MGFVFENRLAKNVFQLSQMRTIKFGMKYFLFPNQITLSRELGIHMRVSGKNTLLSNLVVQCKNMYLLIKILRIFVTMFLFKLWHICMNLNILSVNFIYREQEASLGLNIFYQYLRGEQLTFNSVRTSLVKVAHRLKFSEQNPGSSFCKLDTQDEVYKKTGSVIWSEKK